MADQLYTVVYKRTNKSNRSVGGGYALAGSVLCPLDEFVASGNGVGKRIKQVVSVTFKHYHTISNNSEYDCMIQARAVIVTQNGEVAGYYSEVVSGANITDTYKKVTAAQANTITGIRIDWTRPNTYGTLYYQATTKFPQILTITFYAEEGAHYYTGGEWKDAEIYVRQGDAWKQATPYCYANGQFVQTE